MARTESSQPKTKAAVWIVESLNFVDEDRFKEGEIISRTLRLSGKRCHYSYIRTRDELEALAKEFGNSDYRYLHISCHGNVGEFYVTTDMIPMEEFAEIFKPHLKGRRMFLSTCLAADSKFAREILRDSGCFSVLGPVGTIDFDDAAIFWTAFYHHRFKQNRDSMQRKDIEDSATMCAKLIGQKFRLFYREDGKVRTIRIG